MTTYAYGKSAEAQRLDRLHKLIVDAEGTLKRLQGDALAAQTIIDQAKVQQAEAAKAERRRDNMAREALELERRVAKAERRRQEAKREVWDTNPDEYEHARQQAVASMSVKFYNQGPERLRAAAAETLQGQYVGNRNRNPRGTGGMYSKPT